jgi:hypothetical protein
MAHPAALPATGVCQASSCPVSPEAAGPVSCALITALRLVFMAAAKQSLAIGVEYSGLCLEMWV